MKVFIDKALDEVCLYYQHNIYTLPISLFIKIAQIHNINRLELNKVINTLHKES